MNISSWQFWEWNLSEGWSAAAQLRDEGMVGDLCNMREYETLGFVEAVEKVAHIMVDTLRDLEIGSF